MSNEREQAVQENGPWNASDDGRHIQSDDFKHDVILHVNGDFGDDATRIRYSQEIARRLNAALSAKPQGERVLLCRAKNMIGGWSQSPFNEPQRDLIGVEYRYATLDPEEA